MAKESYVSQIDILQVAGVIEVVGTPSITILEMNTANHIRRALGATVPTAGDAGYAKGCTFIKTTGGAGDTLYLNVGSSTSADFVPMQGSARVSSITAATLTVDAPTYAGSTIILNRAAGIAVTLPAALGTGNKYRFVVGTTFSGSATIKVASATDYIIGTALLFQDAGDTTVGFATANTGTVATESDTITMEGTTRGGIKGAIIEIEDIAAGIFVVRMVSDASGTEATPFSVTV